MEQHIRPLRLFDLSQAEAPGSGFQLDEEEKRHFDQCEECQQIVEIFARQFSQHGAVTDKAKRGSGMPRNGDINNRFGVYKSLCCGLEIVIAEGVTFPDCPRHLKLTTEWKPLVDEPIQHVSKLFPKKKDSSAA